MQQIPITSDTPSLSQQIFPVSDVEQSATELIAIFKKICKQKIAGEEEPNQLVEVLQKIQKKEFEEFNKEQMHSIIKLIAKVFPHLDNSEEIDLAKSLALFDLSDLGNQFGVNIILKESTLNIIATGDDIDHDKISSCLQLLQKFCDYNITLEYISDTPLSNDFIQKHGKFIIKLNYHYQMYSNKYINDEDLEAIAENCPNIESLEIDSKKITSLPEFSASLKKLTLSNCSNVKNLSNFPKTLKELTLANCDNLKNLSNLPENLIKLDLNFSRALIDLPELPANLEELNLSGSKNLKILPKLPAKLKELNLLRCEALTNITEIPESLTHLNLAVCVALEILPELPTNLKMLDLTSCIALTILPALPGGLKTLYLSGCRKLTVLPELSESLIQLDLSRCTLKSIQKFPENLITINLTNCCFLTELPELPPNLEELNLSSCKTLINLPKLPASLEKLELTDCISLTILPELPANLTQLSLLRCEALTNLSELPANLAKLVLLDCNTLSENARISAISPRFAISISSGLSILPMMNINNKQSIGELICQMSTCESIAESIIKLRRELGSDGIMPIALKLIEEQPQIFFDLLEFMPIKKMPSEKMELYPVLKLISKSNISNEKLSASSTQQFNIGDHPEINISMLIDLINDVNFSDEGKPAYIAPSSLSNDGTQITVEDVKIGMKILIARIKSGAAHSGVPIGPERNKWYEHLEALLKEIIFQVTPIFNKSKTIEDLSKEDESSLYTAYREIITIAISGLHCGGRWLKDAIDTNMVLQGTIVGGEENIEQIFARWLDSYKLGIPQQLTFEFTPMIGASMQPHIYNHIGKCLIEKRNFSYPEGTFDLNDCLVPPLTQEEILEKIDELVSLKALAIYFNKEINDLMQCEKRKVEMGEAENLKFDDFIQLMYGSAEPFCQSAITEGESQIKVKALNYGIIIAEKRLKEAESDANEAHNKIEKWQRLLNAAEHGDVHALDKLIKLGYKANSEEQQLAAGKTKIEKRLNRFKEKALTAQQSVDQYTTYLESQDKYSEQLIKLGYGRASSEWQSEKQNLLLEYIHKNQWGTVDYDSFEVNTTTLGTLNLLQTLDYLVEAEAL